MGDYETEWDLLGLSNYGTSEPLNELQTHALLQLPLILRPIKVLNCSHLCEENDVPSPSSCTVQSSFRSYGYAACTTDIIFSPDKQNPYLSAKVRGFITFPQFHISLAKSPPALAV